MKHLLLSPHNDDAVLFASFTLLRHKPDIAVLTVFDSYVQGPYTKAERRLEDRQAIRDTLGVDVGFAGLRDDTDYSDQAVFEAILDGITRHWGDSTVRTEVLWVPEAYADGHLQHNQVSRVGEMLGGSEQLRYYHTYVRQVEGKVQDIGGAKPRTIAECKAERFEHVELKLRALACYRSQIGRADNFAHFLRDQREWVRP